MAKQPASPLRSVNAGEFSQDASGRVDLKQYYSAGLAFKNIEPVPQSGFRQMGGSRRKSRARNQPQALAITGVTTALGPNTGTVVIWQGTVSGSVALVYVPGVSVNAGTASFQVQVLVNGVWTNVGPAFTNVGATVVNRCAAFAPGQGKSAAALRVQMTFSTSATATIGTVEAYAESTTPVAPRHCALTTDEGVIFSAFATVGFVDFFTDANGFCGTARVVALTAGVLVNLSFYAEGHTIGLFHKQMASQRLFLADATTRHEWAVDAWPFLDIPAVDLGAIYSKTSDVWQIYCRWPTDNTYYMALEITVDGETTNSIFFSTVVPATPATLGPSGSGSWATFAATLQTALQALPSLGAGITVTAGASTSLTNSLTIAFGGNFAGKQFSVTANVTNTASVSAVATHLTKGKTAYEPLFSPTRGWPGIAALVQDRLTYALIAAMPGAFVMSEAGEYFELNIERSASDAAILAKLRSQTSETILSLKESKYLLIFTDRGVYFATNRAIDRNTPLNLVLASETASTQNCEPFELEGLVYYVARDERDPTGGHQLLSLAYDDVSTSYNANPESLLASHLVSGVIRSKRQKKSGDLDAAKGWQMRSDGRLVACQMIKNQDIVGFCEWIAADGGLVREIGMDGRNLMWLAVQRGTLMSIEVYDTSIFLQDAVTVTPDLAGAVSGLDYPDGTTVWARTNGYVLGPFTVADGVIQLGDSYVAALVGRWQAPRFETMPYVYVTPNDDVILRPGRIHSVDINIIDTTSIAVGANGQPPVNVKLTETTDLVDQAMPGKTKLISVGGEDLTDMVTGTTAVITQTRPGKLRVRDLTIGSVL